MAKSKFLLMKNNVFVGDFKTMESLKQYIKEVTNSTEITEEWQIHDSKTFNEIKL